MYRVLFALFMFCSFSSFAAESDVLTVDKAVPAGLHLSFPNDSNVQPNISDFNVVNYIVMSNESGERWAVITVKNESSGTRTLNESHLLGLFANGERLEPLKFEQNFKVRLYLPPICGQTYHVTRLYLSHHAVIPITCARSNLPQIH